MMMMMMTMVVVPRWGREGFVWSKKQVSDFLKYENTVYPNTQFNLNVLQEQASPEEVDALLKTGNWPWDETTKYMYMDSVARNTILQIDPGESLYDAMKLYNNNAMKRKLAYNAKEGQFLLSGGSLEPSASMPKNVPNTLKCENGKMEKTVFQGYNPLNSFKISTTTFVEDADIPKNMPGFAFLDGPCNPCSNLDFLAGSANGEACKFSLNVKGGDDKPSPIWKLLWDL